LFGSLAVLTHVPPQKLCPAPQAQLPPLQLWPPLQTRPQLPQLLLSFSKLTHAPPQAVSGFGHSSTQLPWWHWRLAPQALPQPPQLFGSLLTSTHPPLHGVGRSAGQPH
jgi:hypothetical protein